MAGEKWKIGEITVTRIIEIEMSGGLSRFLPDATLRQFAGAGLELVRGERD